MGSGSGLRTWDIDASTTRLCDIYPLGRYKKLYYRYDLGTEWNFEIVRKGWETGAVEGQTYPLLVIEEGVKPVEYGDADDGFC